MRETCINCDYFSELLYDEYSSFHIHNYCHLWKAQVPCDIIFNREGCVEGFDDIECGLAKCWGFKPKNSHIIENFPDMSLNKRY